MNVKNGYEWNEFKEKYADYSLRDIDEEMRIHFNEILRSNVAKEMLENPHIHYDVKRKKR